MDSTMLWRETAQGFSHKQEIRQVKYCEDDVLGFHLHMWFLLNFQLSVEKKDRGKQVVKSHNFKKTELYKGQLMQEFQHWCNTNAMQGFLNADTAAFISVSQISPVKFLKRNNDVCHKAVTTSERKWITWLPVNNRIKIKLKTWKVTGCVWSTLRKPLLVSDAINLNN